MEGTDNAATWAIKEAQDRASARADYWLMVPYAKALRGPVSESEVRELVDNVRAMGFKVTVLKAVEVWE